MSSYFNGHSGTASPSPSSHTLANITLDSLLENESDILFDLLCIFASNMLTAFSRVILSNSRHIRLLLLLEVFLILSVASTGCRWGWAWSRRDRCGSRASPEPKVRHPRRHLHPHRHLHPGGMGGGGRGM